MTHEKKKLDIATYKKKKRNPGTFKCCEFLRKADNRNRRPGNTSYINSSQLYRQPIQHRKLIIVFYNI